MKYLDSLVIYFVSRFLILVTSCRDYTCTHTSSQPKAGVEQNTGWPKKSKSLSRVIIKSY